MQGNMAGIAYFSYRVPLVKAETLPWWPFLNLHIELCYGCIPTQCPSRVLNVPGASQEAISQTLTAIDYFVLPEDLRPTCMRLRHVKLMLLVSDSSPSFPRVVAFLLGISVPSWVRNCSSLPGFNTNASDFFKKKNAWELAVVMFSPQIAINIYRAGVLNMGPKVPANTFPDTSHHTFSDTFRKWVDPGKASAHQSFWLAIGNLSKSFY